MGKRGDEIRDGEPGSGKSPDGGQFRQREQHEGAHGKPWVGQDRLPGFFPAVRHVPVGQQVEIQDAGLIALPPDPPEFGLDRMQLGEKRAGAQGGCDFRHSVDEPWLVGKGYRGAFVPAGAAEDPDAPLLKGRQCCLTGGEG
nr:uncharacterized protein [uncultured bacterium]